MTRSVSGSSVQCRLEKGDTGNGDPCSEVIARSWSGGSEGLDLGAVLRSRKEGKDLGEKQ